MVHCQLVLHGRLWAHFIIRKFNLGAVLWNVELDQCRDRLEPVIGRVGNKIQKHPFRANGDRLDF